MSLLKELLKDKNIEILEAPANSSAQVSAAVDILLGRVDAVYLPSDNTVFSALDIVVKTTRRARLPTFSSDPDSVRKGILACIGYDQYSVGYEAGRLAVQVLKGAQASELPISIPPTSKTMVNITTQKMLGIELLPEIMKNAEPIE